MSNREIGPRVGNTYPSRQQPDDIDIQAFIERTPKTNEQVSREKTNTGWEYSIWMIVIIGVVIVLLVLVLWFIFKKDEVTELQRQIQPAKPQPQQQQRPATEEKEKKKEETDDSQSEKLAQEARDNLAKKKVAKRDIGPVPGIIPDNPNVVGIKEAHAPSTPAPAAPTPASAPAPQIPDTLPDIQSSSVISRLTSNFGLIPDS